MSRKGHPSREAATAKRRANCCRRFAAFGSYFGVYSVGLRPRLSATAASRLKTHNFKTYLSGYEKTGE
jgi:hypothetical protein